MSRRSVRKQIRLARECGGAVYFVQTLRSQRIKIGFSKNPLRRLPELAVGCPEPFRILGAIAGTMADERALHKRFATSREIGEWFRNDPELVAYIEESIASPGSVLRNPWDEL